MNERELYEASLDLLSQVMSMPRDEGEALLSEQCADNPELASYVLRLRDAATSSIDAVAPLAADVEPSDEISTPEQVGRYRIIRRIGEGGMGVVYEAEQENPNRRIALKIMRLGLLASANRRRFEFEKEILARLRHPGIAQIVEAGAFGEGDGRPFFAMELIAGQSIIDYADGESLNVQQRLELIIAVCDAVHHAHQRAVIHRDLKPSNILVDELGRPKVLDFGIARVIDADVQVTAGLTEAGQLIGTLPYMSPEQCGGDPNDIDARTDVFSLGVVAYELITGRLPHDLEGKQIPEMVRIIQESNPRPLRSGDQSFPRDLETIIAKALEKDPARRYSSATELGAEFTRFLRDEPILARPPTLLYHFVKFSKRNKGLVASLILAFVVLVAGIVVTSTLAYREAQQREDLRRTVEHLEDVAEYQLTMLAEADPGVLGKAFVRAFRNELSDSISRMESSEIGVEARLGRFDELFALINTTDAARNVHIERLNAATETLADRLADLPATEARLRQMIAWTYHNYGLYEKAREQTQIALRLRNAHLGPNHKETLYSKTASGVAHWKCGDLVQAERCFRDALEQQQQSLGATHQDTLTTTSNLGGLLGELGRFDEAVPLLHRAVDELQTTFGTDHPHTLNALHNLSAILAKAGRHEEAVDYQERAYELGRTVFEANELPMIHLYHGLASRHQSAGHLDEAEMIAREAIERAGETLGANHEMTLRNSRLLISILNQRGALEEAEALGRHALGLALNSDPIPEDLVADLQTELARALLALDQFAEASQFLERAFRIHQKANEPDRAGEIARAIGNLYTRWNERDPESDHDQSAVKWNERASEILDSNDR